MRDKLLSSAIKDGQWYNTGGRTELINEIKYLITDNYGFKFSDDNQKFLRVSIIKKSKNCLFQWAVGREDCRIEKRTLGRGRFCEDLYHNDKLISTR